jgi:hypothetical protein
VCFYDEVCDSYSIFISPIPPGSAADQVVRVPSNSLTLREIRTCLPRSAARIDVLYMTKYPNPTLCLCPIPVARVPSRSRTDQQTHLPTVTRGSHRKVAPRNFFHSSSPFSHRDPTFSNAATIAMPLLHSEEGLTSPHSQ